MGSFHVEVRIENIAKRSQYATLRKALVDTGSELTWIPEKVLETIGIKREKKDLVFSMANGQSITRATGFAIVRVADHFTVDEVVFAEEGDMTLLGARTLEGLNVMVDPPRKRLVAAGPTPAAIAIHVRQDVRAR
jgi:predicted aspartyl protease